MTEDIIQPELEICDAHHHLFDYPTNSYMFNHLLEDLNSGHKITSTVFVECGAMYNKHADESHAPVGETEFVNGVAAMSASGQYGATRVCAAIVGFADLTLGSHVGSILDVHLQKSDRFRGIRHATGWDASNDIRNSHTKPTQHLLADKTFRLGFEELAQRNLSFDAWHYHHQISELTHLAKAYPETSIILDHFGGPLGIGPYEGKREAIFAQWQLDIEALSQCANVVVKIGGLLMPINGFDFHKSENLASSDQVVAAMLPYVQHTVATFGVDRCMFESNFPVDKVSCSYRTLWNAFKKMSSEFGTQGQKDLLHNTACRIYRLDNN